LASSVTETGPAGTAPVVNNYRYAGEQWDADLGLNCNRARDYAPELGRFWSMESYEGSQGDPLALH
jgi:RHS repeat-associated protein